MGQGDGRWFDFDGREEADDSRGRRRRARRRGVRGHRRVAPIAAAATARPCVRRYVRPHPDCRLRGRACVGSRTRSRYQRGDRPSASHDAPIEGWPRRHRVATTGTATNGVDRTSSGGPHIYRRGVLEAFGRGVSGAAHRDGCCLVQGCRLAIRGTHGGKGHRAYVASWIQFEPAVDIHQRPYRGDSGFAFIGTGDWVVHRTHGHLRWPCTSG